MWRSVTLTRSQRREHLAEQNMENLKNQSIISRQMNLGDTRWRKDIRLFCADFRKMYGIAIRRLQLDGQKKNVKTWTHSHPKTSPTRPRRKNVSDMKTIGRKASMVRDPCRDQWKREKTIHKPWRKFKLCDNRQNNRATLHAFRLLIQKRPIEEKQKAERQQRDWKGWKFSPSWSSQASSLTEWQGSCTWRASQNGKNISNPPHIFTWVSLTGNDNSFVSDEGSKHHTHLARLHTRMFFLCVWLEVWRDSSVWSAAFLCASSYNDHHTTRMPCSAHYFLDFLFPAVPFKLDSHCNSAV